MNQLFWRSGLEAAEYSSADFRLAKSAYPLQNIPLNVDIKACSY